VAVEHHETPLAPKRGQPVEHYRTVATDEEWAATTVVRLVRPQMNRFHEASKSRLVEDSRRPTLSTRDKRFRSPASTTPCARSRLAAYERSIRGRPKWRKTPVSANQVIAAIALPSSVSTISE
jgi:hypothetical protein